MKRKKYNQFVPRNSTKYIGTYPISIKSEWERKFCQWLDANSSVIKWSSENVYIQYYDPVQMKNRRYYPDFYMEVLGKEDKVKRYIVEIKPQHETILPKKTNKKSKKTMLYQEATYLTNQAKWKAAKQYCDKLGYDFRIITEQQLFGKK